MGTITSCIDLHEPPSNYWRGGPMKPSRISLLLYTIDFFIAFIFSVSVSGSYFCIINVIYMFVFFLKSAKVVNRSFRVTSSYLDSRTVQFKWISWYNITSLKKRQVSFRFCDIANFLNHAANVTFGTPRFVVEHLSRQFV